MGFTRGNWLGAIVNIVEKYRIRRIYKSVLRPIEGF